MFSFIPNQPVKKVQTTMLPYDVLENIASFADADSRRALGFLPRPLDHNLLTIMNNKLSKKYAAQYRGRSSTQACLNVISTLQLISKHFETSSTTLHTKACYIAYYIDNDSTVFTFYEGLLYFPIGYPQHAVISNRGLIRGDMVVINKDGDVKRYNSRGIATRVSSYNMSLLQQ